MILFPAWPSRPKAISIPRSRGRSARGASGRRAPGDFWVSRCRRSRHRPCCDRRRHGEGRRHYLSTSCARPLGIDHALDRGPAVSGVGFGASQCLRAFALAVLPLIGFVLRICNFRLSLLRVNLRKVVGEARRLRPATTLTNHAASAARELESRYAVLFEGGGFAA